MELTRAATWHRQAAALVAAADRVGVAEAALPAIRDRLLAQQVRLTAATAATGGWPLALTPSPADVAAAMPALGDLSPAAVEAALAAIGATLDAVDAGLAVTGPAPPGLEVAIGSAGIPPATWPPSWSPEAGHSDLPPPPPPDLPPPAGYPPPPPPPGFPTPGVVWRPAAEGKRGIGGWSPTSRNLVVYAGYAVAVTVLQVIVFATYSEQRLSLLGPCCLLVMPAFSWAAGWVTIGAAFGTGPSDRVLDRSPRLGAVVSLVPDLLLCAVLGVLLANA